MENLRLESSPNANWNFQYAVRILTILNCLRKRLRSHTKLAKKTALDLIAPPTSTLVRDVEKRPRTSNLVRLQLDTRVTKRRHDLNRRRLEAQLTGESLESFAMDFGVPDLPDAAEDDKKLVKYRVTTNQFEHLTLRKALHSLEKARTAMGYLRLMSTACAAELCLNRVDMDSSWRLDEKAKANLEFLLLHIISCLERVCEKKVMCWFRAGLESGAHKHWRRLLKFGGSKWLGEFPDNCRPLSTTWPWSIRPALAVLWGDYWQNEMQAMTAVPEIPFGWAMDLSYTACEMTSMTSALHPNGSIEREENCRYGGTRVASEMRTSGLSPPQAAHSHNSLNLGLGQAAGQGRQARVPSCQDVTCVRPWRLRDDGCRLERSLQNEATAPPAVAFRGEPCSPLPLPLPPGPFAVAAVATHPPRPPRTPRTPSASAPHSLDPAPAPAPPLTSESTCTSTCNTAASQPQATLPSPKAPKFFNLNLNAHPQTPSRCLPSNSDSSRSGFQLSPVGANPTAYDLNHPTYTGAHRQDDRDASTWDTRRVRQRGRQPEPPIVAIPVPEHLHQLHQLHQPFSRLGGVSWPSPVPHSSLAPGYDASNSVTGPSLLIHNLSSVTVPQSPSGLAGGSEYLIPECIPQEPFPPRTPNPHRLPSMMNGSSIVDIAGEAQKRLQEPNTTPPVASLIPVERMSEDRNSEEGQMVAGSPFSPRRGHTHKRPGDPPRNEEGKFVCQVSASCADMVFDRKCEWSKHMDKHERPYKCEAPGCEKLQGFTYSGGLLRHQREVHKMHGGTREPLYCPFLNCKRNSGSGFTRKENRDEHIRRVHRRATSAGEATTGAKRDREDDAETPPQDVMPAEPVQQLQQPDRDDVKMASPDTTNAIKKRRLPNGHAVEVKGLDEGGLKTAVQALAKENQKLKRDLQIITERVNRLEQNTGRQYQDTSI